jgi:hypothetical protein
MPRKKASRRRPPTRDPNEMPGKKVPGKSQQQVVDAARAKAAKAKAKAKAKKKMAGRNRRRRP